MRCLGALLDRVGPDGGRADDRLRDGAQHHADLLADDAVGRGEPALEEAQGQEQRQEADPDHDRQLPAVVGHHQRGDHDLAERHDRDDAAEDQELRDLVDVAGDPGDQRAAALGVLGQQRQVVDVPERLDPQGGQAALGAGEQPVGHLVRRQAGHDHGDRGDHHHRRGVGDVGATGGVHALVEGLLHGDRHDDPADGREHRERQRPADAVLQLRGQLDAAGDRAHRAHRLAGVHAGAGPGAGGAGHGTLTSPLSVSASCS